MPKGVYPHRVKRHAVTQPLTESYRYVPLTRGYTAIVDAEDYERVIQWSWQPQFSRSTLTIYARGRVNGKHMLMHQYIMECSHARFDHKDHDGLNNRKDNLRPCTDAQNIQHGRVRKCNSSGFIGVHFFKKNQRWIAYVGKGYHVNYIGSFSTAEEAARARDAKALELHGEFAVLNFPHCPGI